MMKIIRSLVVAALAAYAVPALAQPLVPGGGAPMVPSGGGGGGSGGTISPGTSGQVAAYTASTTIGSITNAALTALINPATASLSGALPAWPNNTTTFFRGDGTYQTLNPAALGCATANGILFNNATPCDTGLTYAGSGGATTFAAGTITTNVKSVNITQTWNAVGTTFDAPLFMSITNTASAAASLLADFQVGGSSVFTVGPTGIVTTNVSGIAYRVFGENTGIGSAGSGNLSFYRSGGEQMRASGSVFAIGGQALALGGSVSVPQSYLTPDAAGIIGLSNSAPDTSTVTNPAAYRAYNLASSSLANFERMEMGFAAHANVGAIDVAAGGTGTVRGFGLYIGGTVVWDYGVTTPTTTTIVGNINGTGSPIWNPSAGGQIVFGSQVQLFSSGNGELRFTRASATLPIFLTTVATATLQHGQNDAAAPVAQTIKFQSVVAGTNNTVGVNTTIIGSLGTGTGGSGKIIMQVGLLGTTGTVQNSPFPLLSLNPGSATTATVQFGDGTNFTTYDSCTALTTGATGIVACTASAIRFKELYKAVPLNIAGLADLRTDVPWRYREDAGHGLDPSRIHIGLLADDVEKLDARCAVYRKDDPRPSDYEDRCVIAYLVAARKSDHDEFAAYRRAHP